ncbi:MAG: MBG domain-containing protein, partial [Bacillota bacterium]|nr:MBG domain-containing protein [Bacillota bacterium]
SGGGAGIGGGDGGVGYDGSGSDITITGGTVTATSGSNGGAGIGGGDDTTGSGITMDGDAVLYTSSINGEHTFKKGVVYDGVMVSGDAGSYTLIGGVGTVYGNPNVSGFTTPTGSKLGTNLADTNYITVTVPDVDYTGAEAVPTATVTVDKIALGGTKTLVQGTDYTVSISDNDKTNAGAKNATITAEAGSGNVGKTTKAFNVKPVDLSADKIKMTLSEIPEAGYVYDNAAKEPVPVVTLKRADGSEYTLIKDTDYTVSYSNNTNAYELLLGDEGYKADKAPTVKITAKDGGNFTGSRPMNFKILLADMPGFTITPYSGSYDDINHYVVTITPKDGFSDYKVYYSTDNKVTWSTTVPTITDAGTLDFYVKVTKANYKDWISEKQTAKVTPVALDSSMILFNDTNHYYTGQEVKTGITVKDSANNRELVSGTDYTVSYTNNTSVSTESSKAKVTITAENGNYTGSASAEFNIEYANKEYMDYCTVSGKEGEDGWYSSDVTIQNNVDKNSEWGALQFSGSPTGAFADSYTVSAEGETNVTIWFKQTRTGYIGSDSTTVKIDKTAPTWTENGGITIKNNRWKEFLNTISFGLFFKETLEVKASAADSLSGVAAYYYYVDTTGSTTVLSSDALANNTFTEVEGSGKQTLTSLSSEGSYVVYAYAVDKAGNKSDYVCTNGVVLDRTAPIISGITTPSKAELTLTDTSAKISFTGSEAGTCFYMISETELDDITDFATSSENSQGMTIWTEKPGVSSVEMTTEAKQITLSSLSPNTTYTLYLAAVDQAGNSTTIVYSQSFTTCKTMPVVMKQPTISGTYGQTVSAMTLTDGTAKVGNEEITGTWVVTDSNKTAVPGVGTTATYQVTFTPDAKYNGQYETVKVSVKPTVERKAVTVAAENKTKTYGQDNPALTFTVPEGSLVGSDTVEALGVTLSCEATKTSPVKAGGYAITGTTNSANYRVTVIPGVLTITKATPVITATTGYTKTYGDIKFLLDATDNSAEASLQYEVTVSKNPSDTVVKMDAIVTVDASGYVTITGTGFAKITASLPETTNYNAASMDIKITVNKAANAPNMPLTTMNVANSFTKVSDVTLPTGWVWRDADKNTALVVDTPVTATAVYNGADKGNYENETVTVTITRSSCDHVAGEILYTGTDEKAPTCTTDGLGHRECTICHATIESGIVVKAAHKFSSAWTIDVAPTTTSEGSKSHHCIVCGEKNDVTVIPKLVISDNSGDNSDNDGDTENITDLGIGNITKPTIKPIVIPGSFTQEINLSPGIGNNIKPATNTEDNIEEPFIKGENGKEGWDVIRDEVDQVKDGDTVTVDMNGAAVVPSDVLSEIKGKDVTIVFDMGNGITWSVNGQSITGDAIGDIDFSVKTNTNSIPVDIINNITGERYSKQISLSYDGEFGFTAVLSINMEAENAGLFANLFYYNENTGEMEFICYDEIATDGTADLTFTHASDYAIVIDTEPMDSVSDGEVLNGETDSDEEISTIENDKKDTQDVTEADSKTWNPWWVIIICIVVIVITLGAFIVIKKKKSEDLIN